MLVHAYVTLPGKAKWSGPQHTIKMLHFVLFHSVASHIHVHTTKLRNIKCTLIAIGVILRSLECDCMGDSDKVTIQDPSPFSPLEVKGSSPTN